jgi:hypothetical protein
MAPHSCNIKYHIQLLKLINKSKLPDREIILNHLNDRGIHFICEIIHNIINNKLPLTKKQEIQIRKKLINKKKCYRYLSKKKNNLAKKRKIINQNGAGIGLLLSTALPFAIQLLTPLLKKILKK